MSGHWFRLGFYGVLLGGLFRRLGADPLQASALGGFASILLEISHALWRIATRKRS